MRPRRMKISAAILATTLCCLSAKAIASTGSINGTVVDPNGVRIKGAHVLLHADPSGQNKSTVRSDITRQTDEWGKFEVQLRPGFYDVCVMATAFTPQCRKVLVTAGKATQYDTRLDLDPLVVEQLGDRF